MSVAPCSESQQRVAVIAAAEKQMPGFQGGVGLSVVLECGGSPSAAGLEGSGRAHDANPFRRR